MNIYIYINMCVCYMFYVNNMLAGSGGKSVLPNVKFVIIVHCVSIC